MNLLQFLAQPQSNLWISERNIKVYVRKSMRYIPWTLVPCLDLANVEVTESKRGQGIFTAFLSKFETEAAKLKRIVYVESILEPRLEKFLLARGYLYFPNTSEIAPSMFKSLHNL